MIERQLLIDTAPWLVGWLVGHTDEWLWPSDWIDRDITDSLGTEAGLGWACVTLCLMDRTPMKLVVV